MNRKEFFRLTQEEQWRVLVANIVAAEDAAVYARAEAAKVMAMTSDEALRKRTAEFEAQAGVLRQQLDATHRDLQSSQQSHQEDLKYVRERVEAAESLEDLAGLFD